MIKNIRAAIYTHLISCICIIYYISIIIKNTMNYNFEYLDIILFAAIAAFVVLRLRGMLGRRTGYQKKPRSYFNNGTISMANAMATVKDEPISLWEYAGYGDILVTRAYILKKLKALHEQLLTVTFHYYQTSK